MERRWKSCEQKNYTLRVREKSLGAEAVYRGEGRDGKKQNIAHRRDQTCVHSMKTGQSQQVILYVTNTV